MSRETWTSLILGLILSFPVGVISGLYSGLIVAQYQRFADLRAQALQIIREIDFIEEGPKIIFPRRKDVPEFTTISSYLRFLGHSHAADQVLRLQSEIADVIYHASHGRMTFEPFSKCYVEWQKKGRSLKPSVLWILWPGGL
jgi:hypothetical protein